MSNLKIIDYTIIEKNIKNILSTNEICLVVKNDAYGFGLENIINIINKLSIDQIAVNDINEAIECRKLKYLHKIILFGSNVRNISDIKKYNVLPVASSKYEMDIYTKNKIPFVVEIDTGMNRFGFKNIDYTILDNYYIDSVIAHFYKKTANNLNIIEIINTECAKYNKPVSYGGSLIFGDTDKRLRIGAMAYRSATRFYGRVVLIKNVYKNEEVGYEGKFKVKNDARIAVLDVGYCNGIRRGFKGYVALNGRKYKTVGLVCMNHTFVLVDNNVYENDLLEFYGDEIPLSEFLKNNMMSEYESFLLIK